MGALILGSLLGQGSLHGIIDVLGAFLSVWEHFGFRYSRALRYSLIL